MSIDPSEITQEVKNAMNWGIEEFENNFKLRAEQKEIEGLIKDYKNLVGEGFSKRKFTRDATHGASPKSNFQEFFEQFKKRMKTYKDYGRTKEDSFREHDRTNAKDMQAKRDDLGHRIQMMQYFDNLRKQIEEARKEQSNDTNQNKFSLGVKKNNNQSIENALGNIFKPLVPATEVIGNGLGTI